MKTLIFLDYFTPAYKAGGPIRIFEAVARSATASDQISIATQNRDWGDPSPLIGVAQDRWQRFENAEVYYAGRSSKSPTGILALIRDTNPDAIHLNSLWSRTWTMKVLLLRRFGRIGRRKVFLSPHGELAASALGLKSLRKKIFLGLAKFFGLYQGLIWLATSEKEAQEIKSALGEKTVVQFAPPPLPVPFPHDEIRKAPGELKLVFLARLGAMKNIGFLLRVLPAVKGKINFNIFGPIDPEYASEWADVLARLRKLSGSHAIDYRGPIPSSESAKTLAGYELFIQPSLSENFGYSIVEALASGTPVLISDRTPWNEVGAAQIGDALPLDSPDRWIQTLQRFVDMEHEEWREHSRRAHAWVEKRNSSGLGLLKIYESCSADGTANAPKPRSQEDAKT